VDSISQRLKEERQLRGWSQRDLARETGVNTDTISGIETGQHEPRPSTLRKLAEGLDIEVRDFFQEPALPKAEAPREAGLPEWDTAVRSARELRERGRTRMEGLLSHHADSRDRQALREMGALLNEAQAARNALGENLGTGMAIPNPRPATTRPGETFPVPAWEEYVAADGFYEDLKKMVFGAGLFIRLTPAGHEVENAA